MATDRRRALWRGVLGLSVGVVILLSAALFAAVLMAGRSGLALGALLGAALVLTLWLVALLHRLSTAASGSLHDPSDDLALLDAKLSSATDREIAREVARCRRHHLPLSVIVLRIDDAVLDGPGARAWRELVRRVHGEVRRIDLVAADRRRGRLLVVAPHTGSEEVQPFIDRLCDSLQRRLPVRVHAGVAALPDDALIWEDLLEQAERRCEGARPGASLAALPALAEPVADQNLESTGPRQEEGRAAS